MPELPEIEVVRRSLGPILLGRDLRVVRIGPHDMRARGEGRGRREAVRGRRPWLGARELLDGATVVDLVRRGKRLGIVAKDGRALVVQLGMSGQLVAGGTADRHVHVEWSVGDGRGTMLRFRDPRRFGGLTPYGSRDGMLEAWDEELGPDGLGVSAVALARALRGSRAVKAALLDQRSIAGVGNIYADESLHAAGIDPRRRCTSLKRAELQRLAASIRSILRRAVRSGGSTLRDHRAADGREGSAQDLHAVYRRHGLPCFRCGTPIRAVRLGGRSTHWCPDCQRRS